MGEMSTAGDVAVSGERAQFAYDQGGVWEPVARVNSAAVNGSRVTLDLNDGTTLELPANQVVEIIS